MGHLDDFTLDGSISSFRADITAIEKGCKTLGLSVNHDRCEAIHRGPILVTNAALDRFTQVSVQDAIFLGAKLEVSVDFE